MPKKQSINLNNKTILVTGSPGFIGANLVIRLLRELTGGTVVSLDNMNDYYDPKLKEYRLSLIEEAAEKSAADHIFKSARWKRRQFLMAESHCSPKAC